MKRRKILTWDFAGLIAIALVPITLLIGLPIAAWRTLADGSRGTQVAGTAGAAAFLLLMLLIGIGRARSRPRPRSENPAPSHRARLTLVIYIASRLAFSIAMVGILWLGRSDWPVVALVASIALLVAANIVGRRIPVTSR
ncbi:MAG: hypothetical protein LC723_13740 [Actinobacteria bacterium]|nr:hypothetical protein [Actinomycetota bacterium]